MNEYIYSAQNIEGVLNNGRIRCKDEIALNLILREKGFYLLGYKREKEYKNKPVFNKILKSDLASLCNQLATIIDCGINIAEVTNSYREVIRSYKKL